MTHSPKFSGDMFDNFEDMSELVDADIDRVDLVGKAANGHRFILAKSGETNLFPSDMVRDFIRKSQEDEMSDTEIVKADEEDLDVTEEMAEPVIDAEGDEEVPGSPAWEAIDASTAAKWAGILARAKSAIWNLAEREEEEIEAGAEEDKTGRRNLEEAVEVIEYALSLVAPFAVNEAAEAHAEDMEGIEKSMRLFKAKNLATIESFAPLTKSGRDLSPEVSMLLDGAVDSVMKAVAVLPVPPVVETVEVEAEIVKAEMADMSDEELARIAITGMDAERKEALQELGLRSLTNPRPAEAPAEEVAEGETVTDKNGETADDPESTEPAPADEVGTPASETEPAPKSEASDEAPTEGEAPAEKPAEAPAEGEKKPEEAVTKSSTAPVMKEEEIEMVKAALEAQSEEYLAVIKSLEDRIANLEAPAPSKVLSNGALPPAHLMRGQDAGANRFADAELLRKEMNDAPDAVSKAEAGEKMRVAALEALSQMTNR
jgi:hypothetical protein